MDRHKHIISSIALGLTLVATLWASPASAQWRYPAYYVPRDLTAVRVIVKPKEAKVYVDGYYAGIVDDFDGVFQRMHVPPGEHEFVLYLDGYRTVTQKIYLTPDSTYKLEYKMEKNLAGEMSEPPPAPPAPPAPGEMPQAPAPRMRRMPYPPPPGYPPQAYPPQQPYPPQPYPPQQAPPPQGQPAQQGQPPQQMPPSTGDAGTLVVRVQPAGAEVWIDGEQWRGPEGDERLVIQVSEGPHRVEVRKEGYRRYTGDVQVRRGETVPVNVSLTQGRDDQ